MLVGLRNAVRSDDIWVPGSRRYAGLPTLLLPAEQWSAWRDEYCALVQAPTAAITCLEQAGEQLRAALTELEVDAG